LAGNAPNIGIVLGRYPVLSETFILRELASLCEAGFSLSIYAFGGNPDDLMHPLVRELDIPAFYVPRSHKRARIMGAFGFWATRAPRRLYDAMVRAGGQSAFRASFGAAYLARLALEIQPTHLHAHFLSEPAAAARTMSVLLGITFSASAHAHDLFLSNPQEIAQRVRQAAWIRTISRYNRSFLRALVPDVPSRRIEVIRAGVDLPTLTYRAPRHNPDCFRIVSVGRVVAIKGMDILLRAVALLPAGGWILSIAGGGPEEHNLKVLASDLGVEGRVQFLGPVLKEEVSELLHNADIFVLASKRDAHGNMDGIPSALTEAMASGVPTISTCVSGIPELLGGGAGLLVPPDDPEALSRALKTVMVTPSLRFEMSRRGRNRVERGFDLQKTGFFLSRRLRSLS